MNPGTRLQKLWRWNGKPLRVRINRLQKGDRGWEVAWERWHPRGGWTQWRAYRGFGTLKEVIRYYRNYAGGWRGMEDS